MVVEICANSFESAINAEKAGAHRVELCSELALGGITPSFGLIKQVATSLTIPIFVLIRPRSGDFVYSDAEFEIIKNDIGLCKKLGCSGIVSGVLNANHTIDVLRTQELIELSKPLEFTFHRAFDWVEDPIKALDILIEIGAHRVLTSGQEETALLGLETLEKLQVYTKNALTILPGGGINVNNAQLFKASGFNEIHCSLTEFKQTIANPKIKMNSEKYFSETHVATSSYSKIEELLNLFM